MCRLMAQCPDAEPECRMSNVCRICGLYVGPIRRAVPLKLQPEGDSENDTGSAAYGAGRQRGEAAALDAATGQ